MLEQELESLKNLSQLLRQREVDSQYQPDTKCSYELIQNGKKESERIEPPAIQITTKEVKEIKGEKHPNFIQFLLGFEGIWRIMFIITCFVGGILMKWIYRFHTDPQTASIPKGQLTDFKISVFVAGIIWSIRSKSKTYLYPKLFKIMADRKKVTEDQGRKQAENLCKWTIDIVYYFLSSIAGWLILRPTPYLPTCLLGHGKCLDILINYPTIIHVDYLYIYYLIQGGTHLYSLTEQMVNRRDEKKFFEYALHHSVTLLLIVFSYMMNLLIIGATVFLIHDISDTGLLAIRFYTSLQKRNRFVDGILSGIGMLTWIYTRNIMLPFCVIRTSAGELFRFYGTELHEIIFPPGMFMVVMLGILSLLHVYWTIFFVHAIKEKIVDKKQRICAKAK